MPPPGKNIIAGNRLPVLQTLEIDRSLTEAQRVRQVYKGESVETLQAFDEMARGYSKANFRQNGMTAEIELTSQTVPGEVGTPGTSIDSILVQEIAYSFNAVQVSIWDAIEFDTLTALDISACLSTYDEILEVRANPADDVGASGAALVAQEQRTRLLNGLVDSYSAPKNTIIGIAMELLAAKAAPPTVYFPVITYRQVVAAGSAITLASEITGALFTTAQLNARIPFNRFDGTLLRGRIPVPAVENSLSNRGAFWGAGWEGLAACNTLSDGNAELLETYTYGFRPLAYFA